MFCETIISSKYLGLNIFNITTSLMMFILLIVKSRSVKCCNQNFVSLKLRGTYYRNTVKITRLACLWNFIWIIYQVLLAISDNIFKWPLIILRGCIWIISLYLEFIITFFVTSEIDVNSKQLAYKNIIALSIGIISGIGSIFAADKIYNLYDFSWSVIRFALYPSIFTFCSSRTFLKSSGILWTLFITTTYLLNSIQELMHYFDDSKYYCVLLPTKIIYLCGLIPVLYYSLNKINDQWNQTMTNEFETCAKKWLEQVNSLFPGENKAENVAKNLRSIIYSPIADFILSRKNLENLNIDVGGGSFGKVKLYKYNQDLVAVKFVSPSALLGVSTPLGKDGVILQFKNEFSRFLELQSCPHVVKLVGLFFDMDNSGPLVGIAMEYAEHGSLYSNLPYDIVQNGNRFRITRDEKLLFPKAPSKNLAIDIAEALNFIHTDLNSTFVDLKPMNIVIDSKLRGKLVDLASIVSGTPLFCSSDCKCIKNGESIKHTAWTEAYAAPELLTEQVITKKCDVWAFGFVLWQLFTGMKCPFVIQNGVIVTIEDKRDVLLYYVEKGLRPPIPINIPHILSSLINSCWKINPTERPSMSSILDILNNLDINGNFYQIDCVKYPEKDSTMELEIEISQVESKL